MDKLTANGLSLFLIEFTETLAYWMESKEMQG